MTKLGAYVDDTGNGVLNFEDWLGRGVDFVSQHTGRANWSDYESSVSYAAYQVAALNKPIYWTIPMFANGGTLESAADGTYRDHWVAAAKTMLAARPDDTEIVVRFGEEFNGGWMPWAAKGKEAAFIDTYRGMVDAFRSVSEKFTFVWNVNVGNQGMDPEKAYPGDSYVNYISMDMYYNTTWDSKDPTAAFNTMLTRDYGLNWLAKFADAHGKPMAFPEWGVMSDNAGPFVEKFAAWMETHNVAYQAYWNSNADYKGKLTDGTKANAGAAFIDAFSGSVETHKTAPVGLADAFSMNENGVLTMKATAGVLHNDTDVNNDALTAMLVDGPSHGTLSLQADGGLTYTPQANYSGVDSFTYVPRDGTSAGAATKVTITITDTHDAAASGRPFNWISGTSASDTLAGDSHNNYINGGAGRDVMKGGLGDDTYVVDQPDDVVIENPGEGIDTVESWTKSYVLSSNVENLILRGTGQTGTGNELSNGLTGGTDNDILNGKGGDDWLTGNGGSDTFVFERGTGHDVVRDFATSGTQQDMVKLIGFEFTNFAQVKEAMVQVGDDVRLNLTDGSTVTFLNHKVADFAANDFSLPTPAYTISGSSIVHEGENLMYTVSRTADNGVQAVTYSLGGTATAGADYEAPSGTLTFQAGEMSKQIVIATKADAIAERNESVTVALKAITGAGSIASPMAVSGVILDEAPIADQHASTTLPVVAPAPSASVYTIHGAAAVAEGSALTFTVSRSVDDGAQTVSYDLGGSATAGIDYDPLSGKLAFTAGELSTHLIVTTKADMLFEGTDSVAINLTAVTGAGKIGAEGLATGSILDVKPTAPLASGSPGSYFYGTAGNDTLVGNKYNNYLNGYGGSDITKGGLGDDTYNVESMLDKVVEDANEGIDTIETWGGYTLPSNVENLKLLGTNLVGTGNELANLIIGGKGKDVLNGKAGNDWLTGGAGLDTFVFEKGTGHDVVTDFVTVGSDHDLVKLTGFGYKSFADIKGSFAQAGEDVRLDLADGSTVTFLNHKVADFINGDALFA